MLSSPTGVRVATLHCEERRLEIRVRRANTNESGLGRTIAVGLYPEGAARVGAPEQTILDMAGNVWEWCFNKQDTPDDVSAAGDGSRVVRGGSWFDLRDFARCAARFHLHPLSRNDRIGSGLRRPTRPDSACASS